jgi:tetratricopeptide (TPR) repeat protein
MKATALLFLALVLACRGHTDLSTSIKKLSARIAEEPAAELYYQRGTEYRALREQDHAVEDFRAALELNPSHLPSQIALIEALGDSHEAMTRALLMSADPHPGSALEGAFLVARIHRMRGELPEALKVIRQLDELTRQTRKNGTAIDLLHAEILLDLKKPVEAAKVLKSAWERTDSIVLRNNWIDAVLTSGETGPVLPLIEEELHSSRFRSSWLIRRARAFLVLDRKSAAQADLQAALREINPRINPRQPDLTLIADRGLIHALSGNPALARRDLVRLQESSYPASSYRLLTEALGGQE